MSRNEKSEKGITDTGNITLALTAGEDTLLVILIACGAALMMGAAFGVTDALFTTLKQIL